MSQSIAPGFLHLRRLRLIALLFASPLFTGCAPTPSAFDRHFESLKSGSAATITVENQHLGNVSVYAIVGGARYRLGTVETLTTRTFGLPPVIPLPTEIGLYVASLADGEDYSSPPIGVRPGASLLLTLENTTRFSAILGH